MSAALELNAEIRTLVGRSASRKMRRLEGKIPAVVYGAAEEGQNLMLNVNELSKLMQSEAFYSQILNISIAGKSQQVVVRDLHRSPDSGKVLHVDFLRVRADQEINVSIPLRFVNEENCIGVKVGGGLITHNLIEVEISCLPADLPEAIEVDVGDLDVGDSIHLSGLNVPNNVSIVALVSGDADRDSSVVTVSAKRGGADLDDELEVAGEAGDQASESEDSESDAGGGEGEGSDS
ncbi:MAG: 50S ribosomal protein L25/general stress protein Ctc [Candidatus Azotimanducaceae bacterium]